MADRQHARYQRGAVSWMARNPVASNLTMALLILGGLLVGTQVKQEVFPEFDLNWVRISVPYPGASPEETEQGIVLAIEEAVQGLDGIKRISAGASEGMGGVYVELLNSADPNKATADIKNAVDRIRTFPEDAERPEVSLLVNRREVISVAIHGDVDEWTLQGVAERARDKLLQDPGISQVSVSGTRPLEISVEVPEVALRRHGLTYGGIAQRIRQASVEVPAGGVRAKGGEVLLRTDERRDLGHEFADINVLSTRDGSELRLGDVAHIVDGFAEVDEESYFDGERALVLRVYRIGDQTPVQVAAAVKGHLEELSGQLPGTVTFSIISDWSEMYEQRMDLMLRNAAMGLVLVLLILGLFLELRLAFWVTMGIPISFCGSLFLMPVMDVSINMISLFAFIVTLGMVVDDAIVVGENIYHARKRGIKPLDAAIVGAKEVGVPVTFSILTTCAAFMPMLMVPGISGKLFRVIPAVVICVLIVSLYESLFILPAHLGHQKPHREGGLYDRFYRRQQRVSQGLDWFIETYYRPLLRRALEWRYLTIAVGVALLVITIGFISSGRIAFTFLPKIESDRVVARAALPYGTPVAETRLFQAKLTEAAAEVLEDLGGPQHSRGIYTVIGSRIRSGGPVNIGSGTTGGHSTNVQVRLVPSDDREFTSEEFTERWRARVGDVAGVDTLSFRYSTGPSAGNPIEVQLSHRDIGVLEAASAELAQGLTTYAGVQDIDDGFALGKPQLDFSVTELGRSVGITPAHLARELRGAFFGAEALRQQRGRHEVRVYVRPPLDERGSEYDVESRIIRTPSGGEMPLFEAADVTRGRAYRSIDRNDGRRVMTVTADVDLEVTDAGRVLRDLRKRDLVELQARHPGLTYTFEGEVREQAESMRSLGIGYLFAMLLVFALLAIPFKSYSHPLVVMGAIPFGLVGAVVGHLIMGYGLSIMSMMGVVALSGVVVNDSLVLVHAANRRREEGLSATEAMFIAGQRRFRPILLTSLTTFFGLAPMIVETSVQARFLIPMALSLGFGVLFATFVILLIVPASYVVVEDLGLDWRTREQRRALAAASEEGEPAPAAG